MDFLIHHAINQQIVLYKWICTLDDLVPPFSMFYIACGAIIIRNN